MSNANKQPVYLSWNGLYVGTCISAVAYMFIEWLFIITKPNFGNVFGNMLMKGQILLFSSACAISLGFILLTPFFLSSLITTPRAKQWSLRLGSLVPMLFFACLIFLAFDNFTYTLFTFGISTSKGLWRGLYGIGLVGLIAGSYWMGLPKLSQLSRYLSGRRPRRFILPALMGITVFALAWPFLANPSEAETNPKAITRYEKPYPNIVIITLEGINATNLSLYGYERDTTPTLRRLAGSSLVADNAFPNAGNTAGAIVSLLNGKYPTQTRVLFLPDILQGQDAYQHLPGILRSLGYHTAQFSYPYYADAYSLNMQNGFDLANGRRLPARGSLFARLLFRLPTEFAYFIFDASTHISDRLLHVYYLQDMLNAYDVATEPVDNARDEKRVEDFFKFLDTYEQPVFVHLHFMRTHGSRFLPQQRVFSREKDITRQQEWDQDFYDDSILEVDQYIGRIVDMLSSKGILDQTILVVASDHGQVFTTLKRTPLLIRFPNGEYAGRIQANVQNLDILPTILDYLKITKPDWAQGASLIQANLPQRPIVGFSPYAVELTLLRMSTLNEDKLKPPFYQFGKASVVLCSRWYELDLYTLAMSEGDVPGSTAPCQTAPDQDKALAILRAHFQQDGFDLSGLGW